MRVEKDLNDVWKTSKKIRILNESDFEVPTFVKSLEKHFGLDISTLGLSDKDEIKSRLEIMRILMDKNIRAQMEDLDKFFRSSVTLPRTENQFLYYYDQNENPYWKNLKKFIEILEPHRHSSRINKIAEHLEQSLPLELIEKDFAKDISRKLKNVTFLEGVIKMRFDYHANDPVDNSVVVGKKVYRSTWEDGFIANIPKWTKTKFMRFVGLRKVIQKVANSFALYRSNRSSVVTNLPSCVVRDIMNFFTKDPYYSVLKLYRDCYFTVHFMYSDNGLVVDMVGIERYVSEREFVYEFQNFAGFTSMERRRFTKNAQKTAEMYRQSDMIKGLQPIYDVLERSFSFFSKEIKIESNVTDTQYRWYALTNIYNENQAIVNKLEHIRRYTRENMAVLNKLSKIVSYMKKLADEKKLDMCIPEITETHSGTSFNNLAPIEIFEKPEKLIPFTLPTINGHILCLTGRHGGGKSIAGKSILNSVWVAQSGLPIFAKEFKTELKTAIGSIVNDNGEGSTATVFVEKVKTLLEGIGKVPKGESIIFIDEIGKGTQETAGINLGKRILKTVKDKEYSVVFNSQILQLAEYAQSELGAKCFVVNKEHQFKEGIGDGQMDQLLKEKGLDKYLVN